MLPCEFPLHHASTAPRQSHTTDPTACPRLSSVLVTLGEPDRRTIDYGYIAAAKERANATLAARKGKKAMTAQQLAALAVQNHVDAIADSLQHHAGGLLPPQTALQLAYNMYMADETTPNPEYLALDERREHLLVRFACPFPNLPPPQ